MSLSKPITEFQPTDEFVETEQHSAPELQAHEPSLFVPYARLSVTREQVATAFVVNQVANVKRVDLIRCENERGTYYQMFIHFNYWYDTIAANNIRARVLAGEQARMVYEDPHYWNMYINRSAFRDVHKETEDEITHLRQVIAEKERIIETLFESSTVYPDQGQHFRIEYQRREAIHFNAKQQQELQNSTFEDPHMRNRIPPVMANFRPPTPEPAFYNPRSPRTQAPSPNNFEDRMATSATLCDNA